MGLLDILLGDNISQTFKVGDYVEILSYGEYGYIIGISGTEYEVEIDDNSGEIDFFPASDLRKA